MSKIFSARTTLFAGLLAGLITSVYAGSETNCDRACMTNIVDQVLKSMPAHNPDKLPLAPVYAATENSHPAALGMMTAWRSVTKTGKPALTAIDAQRGQAYFALPVSESGASTAMWGRIKVVNREITELEIFMNRSRGDHGFTYSADQMPKNYSKWMTPPAKRQKASRDELEKLAAASFNNQIPYEIEMAKDCQFTEVGGLVIDPGLDDVPTEANAPPKDAPLGCMFPPFRPTDLRARTLVVDETNGIVVTAAVIPGLVYPYPWYGSMYSAFIPSDMKEPAQAQDAWIQRKLKSGKKGLLAPSKATGEVMQVFQVYDGKMQGSQINVYLSGPDAKSNWVK